jgi:hypothetical protein
MVHTRPCVVKSKQAAERSVWTRYTAGGLDVLEDSDVLRMFGKRECWVYIHALLPLLYSSPGLRSSLLRLKNDTVNDLCLFQSLFSSDFTQPSSMKHVTYPRSLSHVGDRRQEHIHAFPMKGE